MITEPLPKARLKFINFDARRDPKTSRWCIQCQKDLKPSAHTRTVRVIEIGGGPYSLHPDDEVRYDSGALLIEGHDLRDLGQCLMGLDCARSHGMEWTKP